MCLHGCYSIIIIIYTNELRAWLREKRNTAVYTFMVSPCLENASRHWCWVCAAFLMYRIALCRSSVAGLQTRRLQVTSRIKRTVFTFALCCLTLIMVWCSRYPRSSLHQDVDTRCAENFSRIIHSVAGSCSANHCDCGAGHQWQHRAAMKKLDGVSWPCANWTWLAFGFVASILFWAMRNKHGNRDQQFEVFIGLMLVYYRSLCLKQWKK